MKKPAISMLIIFMLVLLAGVVKADDVVVKVTLDKTVAKYNTRFPRLTSFTPVRVTLSIENLSDYMQDIEWKDKYHFWLLKVSPLHRFVDLDPIVAEGDLTAAHGIYGSPGPIEPHSAVVVAYGVLPDAITLRRTYRGYLLPGTYVLRVEIPTGLSGSSSDAATETTLFIVR